MSKEYYVYIITNFKKTVFYIGVTNDLKRRVYEHKHKLFQGFSQKYNLNRLVYYDQTNDINSAITREKQLKSWRREWKVNLIKSQNPNMEELVVD